MSMKMRLCTIILIIFALVTVIYLVKRNKLNLKYSLVWIFLLLLGAICVIFPQLIMIVNKIIGFQLPSNLIFAGMIFILFVIALSLTVIVSSMATRTRLLLQEVSLLKERVRILEDEKK